MRLQVGVTEVVLAVNYKPEVMMEALVQLEKKYNVKLTCSVEHEPMGTGEPPPPCADARPSTHAYTHAPRPSAALQPVPSRSPATCSRRTESPSSWSTAT